MPQLSKKPSAELINDLITFDLSLAHPVLAPFPRISRDPGTDCQIFSKSRRVRAATIRIAMVQETGKSTTPTTSKIPICKTQKTSTVIDVWVYRTEEIPKSNLSTDSTTGKEVLFLKPIRDC